VQQWIKETILKFPGKNIWTAGDFTIFFQIRNIHCYWKFFDHFILVALLWYDGLVNGYNFTCSLTDFRRFAKMSSPFPAILANCSKFFCRVVQKCFFKKLFPCEKYAKHARKFPKMSLRLCCWWIAFVFGKINFEILRLHKNNRFIHIDSLVHEEKPVIDCHLPCAEPLTSKYLLSKINK